METSSDQMNSPNPPRRGLEAALPAPIRRNVMEEIVVPKIFDVILRRERDEPPVPKCPDHKTDMVLRDIPVIMLTMVDDPVRGFTLGASDYATKPVNRRQLSHILQKYTCLAPPCPVLVIDDEASARQLTRAMLEKEGWAVSEAENGVEALASMVRERPSLIFLDLMMPEMDGFAFAAEVRLHPEWRSIPIVVLTSRDLTSEDRSRLNGHVEKILRKHGDSRESLLEQVRDLLAGSKAPRSAAEPAEMWQT